jgi:hypothetical protein
VLRVAVTGGFERPEVHISRTPVRVDEAAGALADAVMTCVEAADEIGRDVAERESEELFDAGLVMLLFEARPFSEPPARPPRSG